MTSTEKKEQTSIHALKDALTQIERNEIGSWILVAKAKDSYISFAHAESPGDIVELGTVGMKRALDEVGTREEDPCQTVH